MTNENYMKCRTCRFCRHLEGAWFCLPESRSTTDGGSCGRYRPGCCENCTMYDHGVCRRDGQERFELDVCTEYDPAGVTRTSSASCW